MNKNSFYTKSESHTAKLLLSVVLRFLGEIHREVFFLDKKVTIAETSTEILRMFVFLTMFEIEQILWKIEICLNNFI